MNLFYEQIANFPESRNFLAAVDRRVPRPALPDRVTVRGGTPQDRARLLAYFNQTSLERAGILQGDYLLLPDLHLIVDANGVCLKLNTAWEDYHGAYALERCYSEFNLRAAIDGLMPRWHAWPHIARPAILSDLYLRNYFHCSLELIPRLRLIPPDATLLIHEGMLETRFQANLLALSMGTRRAVPVRSPMRVTDPLCVHDRLCSDGIRFLHEATGLRATPGTRRLYLRRAGKNTRYHAGGGIAETPDFLSLLQHHGFETIEFGAGARSVAEQVRMLDGAAIVLAPHGAALTNIAYLTPPVSIVEIMGPAAARPLFMHVSAVLGFGHHVLYTDRADTAGNLLPDMEALAALLATSTAQHG
jgi:capsular polysaccharide biosynthesis protein